MSERLSIDEIIEIMKSEYNEQKQMIEFLETSEELECYIAPHRKAMNECNQIAEYLEELKNLRGAMERILTRLEEIKKNLVVNAISDYLAINYALAIDSTIKAVKEEGGHYRNRYFRTYRDMFEGVDVSDVIAWQPLPQPYKKEGLTDAEP